MIEILFGESEGGAMRLAKNYQEPDYEDGPTAWLGEKPDKATFEDMFAGEAELLRRSLYCHLCWTLAA